MGFGWETRWRCSGEESGVTAALDGAMEPREAAGSGKICGHPVGAAFKTCAHPSSFQSAKKILNFLGFRRDLENHQK